MIIILLSPMVMAEWRNQSKCFNIDWWIPSNFVSNEPIRDYNAWLARKDQNILLKTQPRHRCLTLYLTRCTHNLLSFQQGNKTDIVSLYGERIFNPFGLITILISNIILCHYPSKLLQRTKYVFQWIWTYLKSAPKKPKTQNKIQNVVFPLAGTNRYRLRWPRLQVIPKYDRWT